MRAFLLFAVVYCCIVTIRAWLPSASRTMTSARTKKRSSLLMLPEQQQQQQQQVNLKVLSMNILAPCYNTMDDAGNRYETEAEALVRNNEILSLLLSRNADVICLQEFSSGSESLRKLYIDGLWKHGYSCSELRRTNHWRKRADGLACFVRDERVVLQDTRRILFHDCGDRVAQLLLLAITGSKNSDIPPQQVLLVNTHLLFPHNEFSSKIRMREMTKILGFVESYRQVEMCSDVCGRADVRVPVILAGDFNGTPNGKVYQFARSQNFESAMEQRWGIDSEKWRKWITHVSHLKKECAVDHIFYLNPHEQTVERLPPIPDWTNLVFREVMERIRERGGIPPVPTETGAVADAALESAMLEIFDELDKDHSHYLTREEFEQGLLELGFGKEGEPALTSDEIDALLQSADVNGDGTIDFKEFCDRFSIAATGDEDNKTKTREIPFSQKKWLLEERKQIGVPVMMSSDRGQQQQQQQSSLTEVAVISKVLPDARPLGELTVSSVSLFPPQLEQGIWPADYHLSDHGMVECEFKGNVVL